MQKNNAGILTAVSGVYNQDGTIQFGVLTLRLMYQIIQLQWQPAFH